jgi:hypothetical protein
MNTINEHKLPSIELSAVVTYAVLAGLIPKDQQDLPITDVEICCDFASLIQFKCASAIPNIGTLFSTPSIKLNELSSNKYLSSFLTKMD